MPMIPKILRILLRRIIITLILLTLILLLLPLLLLIRLFKTTIITTTTTSLLLPLASLLLFLPISYCILPRSFTSDNLPPLPHLAISDLPPTRIPIPISSLTLLGPHHPPLLRLPLGLFSNIED